MDQRQFGTRMSERTIGAENFDIDPKLIKVVLTIGKFGILFCLGFIISVDWHF